MKPQSKTDWARVKQDAGSDAPIGFDPLEDAYDPNDAEAVAAFWAGAVVRRGAQKTPTKVQTAIRFDADVLAALKASGKGWQTRVNDAMREWLRTHTAV